MIIKLMNYNQKSKIIPNIVAWKIISYYYKSKNRKYMWITFAKGCKRIWKPMCLQC